MDSDLDISGLSELDEDMNKVELFSMNSLLEIFDVKIDISNHRKFEFNGKSYELMFDWNDGMTTKPQVPSNLQEHSMVIKVSQPPTMKLLSSIKSTESLIVEEPKLEAKHSLRVPKPNFEMKQTTSTFLRLGTVNDSERSSSTEKKLKESSSNGYLNENIDKLRSLLKDQSLETSLVFMFASPLLNFFSGSSHSVVPPINYQKEFVEIEKSLDNSRQSIVYQRLYFVREFFITTLDNLPDVLIRNPYVLHFSGHGLKNSVQQLGQEAVLRRGDGDMLLFEDDKLCGVLLSEKDLKTILQQCRTNIKVAVVLSCHSEFIGQIFYNAGIKHVICIKEEYEISDSAAIIFAGTFYKLLFSDNYNICTAFMAAKTQVQVQGSVG